MKYEQVYSIISDLAASQEFYGRLKWTMDNEWDDEVKSNFESCIKDCKDNLDLILLLES